MILVKISNRYVRQLFIFVIAIVSIASTERVVEQSTTDSLINTGDLAIKSKISAQLNGTFNLSNISENICSTLEVAQPMEGWTKVVLILTMCLISMATIFGNILIVIAVLTFHELQTITNMFVGSLACADLIMGAVVIPVGIPYDVYSHWSAGKLLCDIWTSIDVLTVTASIMNLCAIAIDRYFAITKPFTYTMWVTRSRARCVISLIWIISASIAFIPIQLGWWKEDSVEAKCCYDDPHCCDFKPNGTYAIVSSCVSFYIPLIIMLICYAIVFKEAIRHASQIDDQTGIFRRASMPGTNRPLWNRQQRRTVFTMGYIMGIFTVCWLPFFILNVTQVFCNCIPGNVFRTLNWLGYLNSLFNPFIYCHNRQFRIAITRLLTCIPCSYGLERTKRASLSDSFPRYRDSQRESSIYMLASFFQSVRRKSRRSTSSNYGGILRSHRQSSPRSPTKSPRHARFADDGILNNNNVKTRDDLDQSVPEVGVSPPGSTVSDSRSESSYVMESAPRLSNQTSNGLNAKSEPPIEASYVYERFTEVDKDRLTLDVKTPFVPSRRYSDFGNNCSNHRDGINCTEEEFKQNGSPQGKFYPAPVTKSRRSKSLFPNFVRNGKKQEHTRENSSPEIPKIKITEGSDSVNLLDRTPIGHDNGVGGKNGVVEVIVHIENKENRVLCSVTDPLIQGSDGSHL